MPLNVDSLNAGTISQNGEPVKPYKVYSALLTQTGTDAPVATVLENTIGDIVWTYDTVGGYEGILVGAFPLGKTFMQIGNISNTRGTYIQHNQPMDSVYIEVTDNDGVTYIDNVLSNTSLEIRVYN
jgi:hypothetical protein